MAIFPRNDIFFGTPCRREIGTPIQKGRAGWLAVIVKTDGAPYSTSGDYNMQMETTPLGPNPCWAGAVQPRQLEMIALVAIDIIMKMGNLQTFLLSSVPNLLQTSS